MKTLLIITFYRFKTNICTSKQNKRLQMFMLLLGKAVGEKWVWDRGVIIF